MSIISDACHGRISWLTAAKEIGDWFAHLAANAPPEVQQALGAAQSELKQAASDAIGLADTLLGPIIGVGAATVEGAFNAAATQALGPNATAITPSVDAAIAKIADGLKAAIDAEATALRVRLTGGPTSGGH